jgi:hypothetical protein
VFGKALHTKKLFDIHSAGTCTRCGLKGHDFGFCPFRSTRVPKEEQSPFMEELLRMDLFDISVYAGMEPEEAKEFLFNNGEERNPWRDSRRSRDNLRKNLGFWYFIGTPKNVLSWLGYGLMLRCLQAPQRLEFSNHPSCAQHLAFVEAEVRAQAKSGRFAEVSEDEIEVCNPIHVDESVKADGSTKLRICNDNRYVNGHLAHMCFRMETLERSVPAVVEPGDFLASADIGKAYYQVWMHESAWPLQGLRIRGHYYQGRVLLFGGSQAPWVFTKINKPSLSFFRVLLLRV